MGNHVLLFNHTHTPDSNRFESDIRGLTIDSHATDYLAIVKALPKTFDVVFVKTDHWKTDPAYFDRLQTEIARLGGSCERFETHLWFELCSCDNPVLIFR